ncbi:MAG: hypothetical protein AB7G23_19640 [Vicinamibacterales bacterium]
MTLVDLLMAAEAAEVGTAVRRTVYRHVHLSDRPLVVVAYNLSGEAAAPLGIMYGTEPGPEAASLVVSAEPRNRESRFAAINAFASDLVEFVRPFLVLGTEAVPRRPGAFRQVASSAPQVIVPNRATRAYLGARLGRSLRYLGRGDTHEVPEATQWAGAHLSWLAEHANLPGQSTFLAMTETLSQHYVTGQSALEDENLATVLAWIDGLPRDALPELERLEQQAFGPVPNPEFERRLQPFVKAYTDGLRAGDDGSVRLAYEAVEAAVRDALSVAYTATHRAIGALRAISPAATVVKRWNTDVYEWTAHARRSASGIPRFARRHDPLRAAATLQRWSSAAEELEIDQAFDDPLIMAKLDAAGRCVTGEVTSIDFANKEVKPGNKNRTSVPLIEMSLTAPTRLLSGEVVRWVADRRVTGEVRGVERDALTVAVTAGTKALAEAGLGAGVEAMFVGLDPWGGQNPWAPDAVPWTHRPTTSELAGDDSVDTSAAAGDGSPDMSVAELASIPILEAISPADEPGVVL